MLVILISRRYLYLVSLIYEKLDHFFKVTVKGNGSISHHKLRRYGVSASYNQTDANDCVLFLK